MNGNDTHPNPSLTDNDNAQFVAGLENPIADLKAQRAQASDRETALVRGESRKACTHATSGGKKKSPNRLLRLVGVR